MTVPEMPSWFGRRPGLFKLLRSYGMKWRPERGITASSPDGCYFDFSPDNTDVQVIVIGRMERTPSEITDLMPGYRVVSVGVMAGAPEESAEVRRIILERGILSIVLREDPARDPPASHAENAGGEVRRGALPMVAGRA